MNWEKALITFPKLYPPQTSRGIKIWQKLWLGVLRCSGRGGCFKQLLHREQAMVLSHSFAGSIGWSGGYLGHRDRKVKGRSKNRTLPASDFSRVRTEQGNRAASGRIQLVNAINAESAAWLAAAGAALAIDSRVSCLRVLPPARLL